MVKHQGSRGPPGAPLATKAPKCDCSSPAPPIHPRDWRRHRWTPHGSRLSRWSPKDRHKWHLERKSWEGQIQKIQRIQKIKMKGLRIMGSSHARQKNGPFQIRTPGEIGPWSWSRCCNRSFVPLGPCSAGMIRRHQQIGYVENKMNFPKASSALNCFLGVALWCPSCAK